MLAEQITIDPVVMKCPPWLPGKLKDELAIKGRIEHVGTFSRADKKIMRKRRKIRPSQWAEKHRVITLGSLQGPWKNSVTPYSAGIMDASFFPSVQYINICKVPQSGISEAINTCIGYCIDRQPGPVLYHYPDRKTTRENFFDRISPMIKFSQRLRTYMTGKDDDISGERISLQHMPIYGAWSRSAASLANKPIRYLVNDEVDKSPETSGKKETSPTLLSDKRTITFRYNRIIWTISTPTIPTGRIWIAITEESQVVFEYYAKCQNCGTYQVMAFTQIKWPEAERDPERVQSEELAEYECIECQDRWNDHKRNAAVRAGEWRSLPSKWEEFVRKRKTGPEREKGGIELFDYLKKYRPLKIGFLLPSWYSPFVSLSEAAAAFIKSKNNKTNLKDFRNSHEARPWIIYQTQRKEDQVLKLRDDRPRGIVPGDGVVAYLVAGIDTQDDGFWFRIRAFSYGGDELLSESWGVREGFATTFEMLERILWLDEYKDTDGNSYVVQMAIQDALGHRTSEVYNFCLKNQGRVFPSFGKETMAQSHSWTSLQFYPGGKKPLPYGLKGIHVNTNYFKDQLSSILQIAPSDPGAWHENAEFEQAWASHMTAEYIGPKGTWLCPKSKENHLWDCSVLCLAAHDVLGGKFMRKPDDNQISQGNFGGGENDVQGKKIRRVRSRGVS